MPIILAADYVDLSCLDLLEATVTLASTHFCAMDWYYTLLYYYHVISGLFRAMLYRYLAGVLPYISWFSCCLVLY